MPKEVAVQVSRLEGSPLAERGKFAQAYEHTPIEKKILERRGRLFVVLNIDADPAFDTALAGKLVWDSLVDEYFSDTDETPFKALEKAVLAAKNRLVNLTHPLEGDKPASELAPGMRAELDLIAVVVWQSPPKAGGAGVLYLARHGKPTIFLRRGGHGRKLLGGEEPTSIASLLIEDKDEVFFGSRDFGKNFSLDALPETSFLKKQFSSGHQVPGMAATILELSLIKAASPKPVPLVIEEGGTESRTELFEPKKKPQIPVGDIKRKAAKYLEKLPMIPSGRAEDTARSVQKKVEGSVSTLVSATKSGAQGVIDRINRGVKSRISHGQEIYLDRRRPAIALPKVISVLILVFLLSVTFTLWQQRRQARSGEFASLLSSIEETLTEAEDLVGLSDDRAEELWGEAMAKLENALALSPKSEALSSLSQKADKLLNRIEKINPITEDNLFYDLTLQGEVEALGISGNVGEIYVVDGESNATLAIKRGSPPQVEEATANEVKKARKIVMAGDDLLLLADNKLYRYTTTTGRADNPVTFQHCDKVAAIDHYLASNIYFLVPKHKQIYRFLDLGGGNYSGAYNWLLEPVDLGKAVDMAVDGSIWVLTRGGVLKLMAGKREPFSLKDLPSSFTDLTAIYTRPDFKRLYIADGRRVLVFGKDGKFKKQFRGDALGEIVDLWVTDDEKRLFILTKDKVFKVGL